MSELSGRLTGMPGMPPEASFSNSHGITENPNTARQKRKGDATVGDPFRILDNLPGSLPQKG
jgi:hypothetical protein